MLLTIASLGGACSFRVTPGLKQAPQPLAKLRRNDRLAIKLGRLACTANQQGNVKVADNLRSHKRRVITGPCLPVFAR
jgi:hypothetical protein